MIKASLAWFVAVGSLMAIAHAAGESREFPGVWGGVWFGSVWLFLCTSRWAGWLLLWRWQRDGRLVRNVAVLGAGPAAIALARRLRSEEHTSELQSLMRLSYAVFCLKKKKQKQSSR